MDLLLGGLIVAAVVAVAVTAMLLVRRRAPDGGYFSDGDRASGVVQQFETAQFLPLAARARLGGELMCYGRSVIGQEWPRMRSGSETGAVNPWGLALFRTMQAVQPATAAERSAYDKWFDLTSPREEARRDRVHASEGVIPTPLWRVLFFIAATLLLIGVLDKPYRPGPGELRPVAMQQTLGLIDQALDALGQDDPPPCDAEGRPA